MGIEAVVDLGTNSALLTVARVGAGAAEVLHDECTIIRLGQGVDAARCLAPEAKERARVCLARYGQTARSLHAARLTIVSTAVLRDADDGQAFLDELVALVGGDARGELVSGEREAVLSLRGALQGLAGLTYPVLVIDVGGGSSEVILAGPDGGAGERAIAGRASLQMGAVRVSERFVRSDPPSPVALEAIEDFARELLREAPPAPAACGTAVAVAGTATTLAAIDLALEVYDGRRVHGHRLSVARIEALRARLVSLSLARRREVVGLPAARADVIVGGITVLLEILRHYGQDALVVSDGGLRLGLLAELAAAS